MDSFNEFFPSRKNEVKIIVAEQKGQIIHALHLFIEVDERVHERASESIRSNFQSIDKQDSSGPKKIGFIYDFLSSPEGASVALKDPDDTQQRMVQALELIGMINKCIEIKNLTGLPHSANDIGKSSAGGQDSEITMMAADGGDGVLKKRSTEKHLRSKLQSDLVGSSSSPAKHI